MNAQKTLVSVVIPVFNEEQGLQKINDRIQEVFQSISEYDYEIIFVDDGSADGSLDTLIKLSKSSHHVNYISFSRNFGHQAAVKAGLDNARGDCAISMDADLQHPPELIPEMLQKWKSGYDIVYTIRIDDRKVGLFKRITSRTYYRMINMLSDIKIDRGAADFRLLDRSVLNIIRNLKENNLFLRGMVKWLGFSQYGIKYRPGERKTGETKYNLRKMFSLAIEGITSFSVRPLRLAAWIGLAASSIGFLYGAFALYGFLFADLNVTGWTSLITAVIFLGGIQLITLGIIGEYIGKLFMQVKGRPNYIIKKSSLDETK